MARKCVFSILDPEEKEMSDKKGETTKTAQDLISEYPVTEIALIKNKEEKIKKEKKIKKEIKEDGRG